MPSYDNVARAMNMEVAYTAITHNDTIIRKHLVVRLRNEYERLMKDLSKGVGPSNAEYRVSVPMCIRSRHRRELVARAINMHGRGECVDIMSLAIDFHRSE